MPYRSGGRGVKGVYDLREASRWLADQRMIKPEADAEQARVDREYREEKRRIAELQRKKLEGTLVEAEVYREKMLRTLAMIRNGVEAIHKAFGNEAAEMLTDIATEAAETICGELDTDRDSK